MNAPGWQPDPTTRHEYRYWDGSQWTDDVSDGGVTSVDPVDGSGAAAAGGYPSSDATQAMDPATQAYGGAPYGGPPPPGAGTPPPGVNPSYQGYGADPYAQSYGGGSGQMPPGQPAKKGPNPALIIGIAVVVLLLLGGGAFALLSGDDGDDDRSRGGAGGDVRCARRWQRHVPGDRRRRPGPISILFLTGRRFRSPPRRTGRPWRPLLRCCPQARPVQHGISANRAHGTMLSRSVALPAHAHRLVDRRHHDSRRTVVEPREHRLQRMHRRIAAPRRDDQRLAELLPRTDLFHFTFGLTLVPQSLQPSQERPSRDPAVQNGVELGGGEVAPPRLVEVGPGRVRPVGHRAAHGHVAAPGQGRGRPL